MSPHRRVSSLPTVLRVIFIGALLGPAGQVSRGYDIYDYAREVCELVGAFPSFNAFDPSFSHEIPLTQDGAPLTGLTATPNSLCDRPPLLPLGDEGQAVPHSRIGRLPAFDPFTLKPTDDVIWMFITRRYVIRTDPNYPMFEDVAIVGHNKRNGATAFFQAALESGAKDVRKIPSPMGFRPLSGEPTAADFWLTPQRTAVINCSKCHDNGPFIHSPYVDQVKVNDQSIVPFVDRSQSQPYWFVGSQEFSDWSAPRRLVIQGNLCLSCHNIGAGGGSYHFIRYFTGRASPTQITDAFKTYPLSHYMPNVSLTQGIATREAWEAIYGGSVEQILACKQNGASSSCNWQPFPRLDDPGPAGAIYVDANSSSEFGNGTLQFPFRTLVQGYNAANPGDTIIVSPGDYTASRLTKQVSIVKRNPKAPGAVVIRNQLN